MRHLHAPDRSYRSSLMKAGATVCASAPYAHIAALAASNCSLLILPRLRSLLKWQDCIPAASGCARTTHASLALQERRLRPRLAETLRSVHKLSHSYIPPARWLQAARCTGWIVQVAAGALAYVAQLPQPGVPLARAMLARIPAETAASQPQEARSSSGPRLRLEIGHAT